MKLVSFSGLCLAVALAAPVQAGATTKHAASVFESVAQHTVAVRRRLKEMADSPSRRLSSNCANTDQMTTSLAACSTDYSATAQEAKNKRNLEGECAALAEFQGCMCHAADQCGDDAGRAEVVATLGTFTKDICDNDDTKRRYKESGKACINAINTLCVADQCPKGGFGDITPICATALAEQFTQKEESVPPGFVTALKELQGLTKQTEFVQQPGIPIPGGHWVPNCAKPTDLFLCRGQAASDAATPPPSPGSNNYVTCGEAALDTASTTVTIPYEKQTKDDKCLGVGADGTINQDPLDETSDCCDRPLRPGVCVTQPTSGTETKKSFRCEKRWIFNRIANFRKTCNGKVGKGKYGEAYFLSAKSELQVDKVRYAQTVIDANVMCFPRVCTAADLQNHLESRAEECRKNFMSKCTYTARPIECNVPSAGNSDCQTKATVGSEQWNNPADPKTKWGYTTCDNIMDNIETCTVDTSASFLPVTRSANFAAFLRPALSTAFAVLAVSMLLIA